GARGAAGQRVRRAGVDAGAWWRHELASHRGLSPHRRHGWPRKGGRHARPVCGRGRPWAVWAEGAAVDRRRQRKTCPRRWTNREQLAALRGSPPREQANHRAQHTQVGARRATNNLSLGGYWARSIENKLHWQLERAFREDDSRIRDRNAAENFALLRRVALGLLKRHPAKGSVATKRFSAARDEQFLEEILRDAIPGKL